MLTLARGFTLPEVMLALVFGSVIALGAAKTYPLLRQQSVAVGQHFRLESTLRQLAFGIEKDLRRAGFCAGQCAGRPLLIGQAAGEAAGSCVIVAYDIARSGQWLTSGEDAGYFGYRLRNGGLEGQRGVSQCDGGGWERLLDHDEVRIERFHVAIERGNHGATLARLTLAGRSASDARIGRSLSGSVEMAAQP
ncbi:MULTISPECIES: prepilin peptidase-dependent protein [Serratia]|uniref:prepilin peptidase-dependent protein n=1 Tax=Serratia TaxID=613 RepID=UPI0018D9E852|nr:prepilin peptidase-dependent protein [Serratia marcescens]MBH3273810.1 prepilin peptidase-dependent protein [Serratia marcescens]MCA3997133.1 prepilin peptidase-dependent protein [Serratia marcescens]CAI0843690.1 Type II secretory pathway, component PulJ [Serratia marcescens]CAI1767841.1 Type II secretory pathway, component PulJ [Serratia marcescens]CAI2491411.1 Type II secretory pathway, component PulJ [Serratia marcescens]